MLLASIAECVDVSSLSPDFVAKITVLYWTGLDWTGLDWTGLDNQNPAILQSNVEFYLFDHSNLNAT